MDTITVEERSARMARIRGKDTKPEMIVRRLVHALGFRYRLHRRDLPGVPDLVFPARKKLIFVHGCFWHAHASCSIANLPKSNALYWKTKFELNKKRDRANERFLRQHGWGVLVVWECETKDRSLLTCRIKEWLSAASALTANESEHHGSE